MNAHWIYVTAPNREEARRLGRAVVEERLAACVNILGPIESMYWWEETLETADEVAFIAKTAPDRAEGLIRRLVELHPYQCPCVVSLPIGEGYPPFLEWIRRETRPSGGDQ
jgi:periplasmic divalent cation tolerance protein